MSFTDAIIFTLLNTVVCLCFPKILSIVFGSKKLEINQPEKKMNISNVPDSEPSQEIPTFSSVR
jgi:hypothetical protein